MNTALKPLFAVALVLAGSGAFAAEPSAYEIEMWRSASRLNTVEAYNDYLTKFPTGGFAGLARIAIRQASSSSQNYSTQTLGPKSPALLSELQSRRQESGATHVQLGDRYVGPGVITVGWLGSKQQIVIPPGEWTTLAVFDHSLTGMVPVTYTTIALAQFAGSDLSSLLLTTSTSRPTSLPSSQTTQFASLPRLAAAESCDANAFPSQFHEQVSSFAISSCLLVREVGNAEETLRSPAGLQERITKSLSTLKATLGRFTHRAELHLNGRQVDYTGYILLATNVGNVPQPIAGPPTESSSPESPSSRWATWLQDFRPFAMAGHARRLAATDLDPGASASDGLVLPR